MIRAKVNASKVKDARNKTNHGQGEAHVKL